ncbi:MAG: amidohydrolase family protein [candidate division Zixibacteria bacterium]|nr:amidohydrolase family protein [candidate division Zixibacteria bacterium]
MDFDCILRGGDVVDGTGKRPRFRSDVGIRGGVVAGIGDLSSAHAGRSIEVSGRIVCPGFIDVHVHSENTLLGGRDQMVAAWQGITTHLLAPDGFGWAGLPKEKARALWHYTQFAYGEPRFPVDWPSIESYLSLFPGRSPLNVYPQVPHCAVRVAAMGWEAREATPDELEAMKRITRQWMEAGAGCLCLGLDYQPSANTSFDELTELCKVVAEYDGIYAAHLRYQILGRVEAWAETVRLNRASGIPVHVSHERVDEETAPFLEQADREGVDLTFESYLYPAGMTHITMQFPMWVQAGSLDDVLSRMKLSETRQKTIAYLREQKILGDRQIVGYTPSGRYIGMTLDEAAKSEGKTPEDFAYDLVLEENGVQTFVSFWGTPAEENEKTLDRTAVHPRMMVASDGIYDMPHPHPRAFGCFAQMLRKFVRERGVVSLESAIYKMSGFPAERYRLKDRGKLQTGLPADIAVFDPEIVADRATFADPIHTTVGVDYVFVNGQPVIDRGEPTANRPGQVLRRNP